MHIKRQNIRKPFSLRAALGAGLALSMLTLASCQGVDDLTPKAQKDLPRSIVTKIKAKDMSIRSPIMVRVFKEEGVLEVWKQKRNGRYDLVKDYEICKWSGQLGPKFIEGDRQAPEGFYTVSSGQMNPKSQYHLAFNTGYPNTFDRANNRTGSHLMVHGACSSSGCYSMTDDQIEEIYAFARESFRGGQRNFQFQAFPFRMTPENMARYKDDDNFAFWQNIKEGYDYFEITKKPPTVAVCDKRYIFNATAEGRMSATAACPALSKPPALAQAYQSYALKYDVAFEKALEKKLDPKSPTIQGTKEAKLVSAWSKKRNAGVRVSRLPPSIGEPVAPAPDIQTPNIQAVEEQAPVTPAVVTPAVTAPVAAAPEIVAVVAPTPITEGATPVPTPNPNGAIVDANTFPPAPAETKKPWWKLGG